MSTAKMKNFQILFVDRLQFPHLSRGVKKNSMLLWAAKFASATCAVKSWKRQSILSTCITSTASTLFLADGARKDSALI